MDACNYAMQTMLETVCGKSDTDKFYVEDSAEAREAARALGGRVISEGFDEIRGAGGVLIKRRWAVVRVSTGIVMSTMVANSAAAKGIVKVEQTAEAIGASRVTVDSQVKATSTAATIIEAAKEMGAVKPIKGESIVEAAVKGVTKASARFNVVMNILELLRIAHSVKQGDQKQQQLDNAANKCCEATRRAHKEAWEQAPDKFHREAMKTRDTKLRYYGKRRSRRN